jgi:hypothetical protein
MNMCGIKYLLTMKNVMTFNLYFSPIGNAWLVESHSASRHVVNLTSRILVPDQDTIIIPQLYFVTLIMLLFQA